MRVVHGEGVSHMYGVVTDTYYKECLKIKDTAKRVSDFETFVNELKYGSYDNLKQWYEACATHRRGK